MKPEFVELIERLRPIAIEKWGHYAELFKACEELAELQVHVCKRASSSPSSEEEFFDEVADVLIMVSRLRLQNPRLVDERIRYKLERLENALRSDYERKEKT